MDQVLFIINEKVGNLESVGDVTLLDKLSGANNRGAAFPDVFERASLYKNVARLIKQVDADHVERAKIHQIPVVNPVVTSHIKIEQLFAALIRTSFYCEPVCP